MSLDVAWQDVKDFHIAFNHPAVDKPSLLKDEQVAKRAKWMLEEVDEFREAKNIPEQADAMIDLIYFALGTMVEMGIKPQAIFEIVHSANMSKLWPDGEPRFNIDGKVIKPKDWIDPEAAIINEIEKQNEF